MRIRHIVIIIVLLNLVLQSCHQGPERTTYVSIQDNQFVVNDTDFVVQAINYIVSLQYDGTRFWPCSYQDYQSNKLFLYNDEASSLEQIRAELVLMKEMGMNTVRVVQLAENIGPINDSNDVVLQVFDKEGKDIKLPLSERENHKMLLAGVMQFLDIAEEVGLRVILLVRWRPHWEAGEELLLDIASACRNKTSLLAYDLFNEPLYFDEVQRSKVQVIEILNETLEELHDVDDRHLTTVGLEGIREIFEWDPNLLPVDFVSFHPYEYEPEQVMNEIAWYGKYIHKPWIIGETGIAADNDSVPYEDQVAFAEKTMAQTFACGGIGYSWWQYKDVRWVEFGPSNMGVVSLTGSTTTKEGLPISGAVKPLGNTLSEIGTFVGNTNCVDLPNYYNYSSHTAFALRGRVLDTNHVPIQGGVVLGWKADWSHSYHTVTQADGTFVLTSDFPLYHWMASATMHTMVRDDCYPIIVAQHVDSLLVVDLGDLLITPIIGSTRESNGTFFGK